MNFNWKLLEFSIISKCKCHISNDDYLFQVFTLKPMIDRKEVPAKTELFSKNTKKVGRGCREVK